MKNNLEELSLRFKNFDGPEISGEVKYNPETLKLYIAVLDEFPDFMTPTLVAHAVLGAHKEFWLTKMSEPQSTYREWLNKSFKKVVLRVNQKEFDKIAALDNVYLAHENNTIGAKKACAVVAPRYGVLPNVLRFAKLWKPKGDL